MLYVVFIFTLGTGKPSGAPARVNDKVAHAVAFGVLALVAFPALGRRRSERTWRFEAREPQPSAVSRSGEVSSAPSSWVDAGELSLQIRGGYAFVFATSVGAALEMWQYVLPHRSAEWLDLLADAAGAFSGAATALWLSNGKARC